MNEYSQYDEIISRYFDGGASAAELAQLEALLENPAFAEHASRWCLMHRQIVEQLNEDALHKLMDQFVTGSPGLPKKVYSPLAVRPATGDRQLVRNSCDRSYGRQRLMVNGLALAAALVLGVGAAMWWPWRGAEESDSPGAAAQAPANNADEVDAVIATVTRLVDGVWAPGAPALHHGQPLRSGSRVALRSGMAKVTFECGAEVVLEGPCDFELQSRMLGVLKAGKITADVPRRAFAFAILAPGVDIVDLGTSFGLNVGAGSGTELHVFDGEVLCSRSANESASAPAGARDLMHVVANTAKEFASDGSDASDIAMDRDQFSQLIGLRRGAEMAPQGWISDHLALWLAADTGVSTDDLGRVMSWHDIVYGDNRSAEDALQAEEVARPMFVKEALGGRPAIRFDGAKDFLLTTPLETTDDQTVLFVCQFSQNAFDKSRRWGGQIINYDGPPSRYLSDTLEPGVLQIGEPLLEEQFRPSLLTGQVFAGFIGSTTVEAGRVDAQPVGANAPVVVSYLYDYGRGRAELRINGRSCGEARAFAPQGITSRKIIGRHAWIQNFFHGDLAELLIYNKAMSPQELADATAYLADKYSISLDREGAAQREATP
jgi:hypothetical protein